MKKLMIAVISLSLFASCSVLRGARTENARAEKKAEQTDKTVAPALKKPAVGEMVVARWGPTSWAEGKVEGLTENRAKILWLDDSSRNEVDLTDVFALPAPGGAISVKAGDFTLVKGSAGGWWQGAEIKEVAPGVVKAKYVNGGEIVNLPPEKVLTVTPTVAADIRDAAEKEDFLQKAHLHRPAAPAGYKPQAGDRVLGEWASNGWYGGRIKTVSNEKAFVVWENGMRPEEVSFDKIVPFPTPGNPAAAALDDFVLLKPTGGNWIYGQVTAVKGASIEAKSVDATREYKPGEFLVLE
jgi:hypothetical protein